jgi:hypothetical protein
LKGETEFEFADILRYSQNISKHFSFPTYSKHTGPVSAAGQGRKLVQFIGAANTSTAFRIGRSSELELSGTLWGSLGLPAQGEQTVQVVGVNLDVSRENVIIMNHE